MPLPSVEEALAYLNALEADERAALALSEQKAEEAKLIKARREGFQTAMEILGSEVSGRSGGQRGRRARAHAGAHAEVTEPVRRRGRPPVCQLILRELSFSGQTMRIAGIAKAIGCKAEQTETALRRMESAGQALRNEEGRWAIGLTAASKFNGKGVK